MMQMIMQIMSVEKRPVVDLQSAHVISIPLWTQHLTDTREKLLPI